MADNDRTRQQAENDRRGQQSIAEQTRASQEERRAARKQQLSADKSRLQSEQADRNRAAVEKSQASAQAQPTPTQIENDLAKLGHPLPEKEDDKSGPNVVPRMVQAEEGQDQPGYQTRAFGAPGTPQGTAGAPSGGSGMRRGAEPEKKD